MTAAATPAVCRRLLVPCSVVVKQPGALNHYEGLFRSTCDAVIDAMDKFPEACGISVSRLTSATVSPDHHRLEVTP